MSRKIDEIHEIRENSSTSSFTFPVNYSTSTFLPTLNPGPALPSLCLSQMRKTISHDSWLLDTLHSNRRLEGS